MPVNLSRASAGAPYKYAPPPALAAAVRRAHPGSRDPHQGTTHVFFINRANQVVKAEYGFAHGSYWVSPTAVDTSRPKPSFPPSWLKAAASDADLIPDPRDFMPVPPARYPSNTPDYGGPAASPEMSALALARSHDAEVNDDDYAAVPPQRYGAGGRS